MSPGWALSLEVEEVLCGRRSKFQRIDVYRTKTCGVMLALDGIIQTSEFDEANYHEMLAHVPMFAHPRPERTLVIGGGDGGILREIGRHQCVREMDICEIDAEVIATAKEFLPSTACGFYDPRVATHIMDAAEYIRGRVGHYDVIIVDSTDPEGPGEALFSRAFYERAKAALRPGGILAVQGESAFFRGDLVRRIVGDIRSLFPVCGYALTLVPTYGGSIGICVGSLSGQVSAPSRVPDGELMGKLKYYTPETHKAAFALPAFIQRLTR